MKSTGNKNLWIRWVLNCAFGELSGIGVAGAIAYFVNTAVGEPQTFYQKMGVLFAMLVAGAIEGSLLGYFQWRILREKFTRLPRKEWMLYTITIAVLGWLLGMLPSLFISTGNNTSPESTSGPDFSNPWIFAILSFSAGLLLGAMFGLFQWFSLKKYCHHSHKWIIANAIGWAFGLGWIYLFCFIANRGYNHCLQCNHGSHRWTFSWNKCWCRYWLCIYLSSAGHSSDVEPQLGIKVV